MAIGRIGGPMLKENLIRQGVDLSFETNLLYLDVNNMRVGVNQAVPTVALEVNGAAKFGNVQVNGNLQATSTIQGTQLISNIAIGTAPFTVTSTTQVANLNVALAGTVTTAAQPNITSVGILDLLDVDNINISGNTISSSNTNGNIDISPNGTGNINLNDPVQATSTIQATRFISNVAIGTAPFTVTSTTQVANLNVATAGTASTVTTAAQPNITSVGALTVLDVDNIQINGNTISSTDSNGNIYLDPNGTGRTIVLGTNAVTIPSGTALERPAGINGDLRVNTESSTLEFYNGQWITVAATTSVIVGDSFNGDGSTLTFTLSQAGSTNSAIVSINGVMQQPQTAYTVSGTTLTFVEAPSAGDVIDSRVLRVVTDLAYIKDVNTQIVVNDTSETANVEINGTTVASVSNAALLPGANITYDLGSDTLRWRDLYLSGSSIKLGSIVLKDNSGTLGVFASDGTTPSTSLTTPKVVGGTAVSSALTLQSTSGIGSSDSIVMKVGNNGAITAMTINTSGNTEFRAGTVSLPAITTTGDTNTGIFFPAADTIAFAEGATERMRIVSGGNIGIGTTTPQAKLSVSNGGAAGLEFFVNYPGGGVGTYIQSYNRSGTAYVSTAYDAADHSFRTSGTERMFLNSSGNVGIGTSSPSTKLHVAGELTLGPVSTEGGQVTFHNPDASTGLVIDVSTANNGRIFNTTNNFNLQIGQLGGGTGGSIEFYTNATERLRIASAGQIGIGGANYGTSGQVLTSGGASVAPSWTDSVTPNGTQTLTNKTLTNPSINAFTEGVTAIGTVTTTSTLSLASGTVLTATLTASTACTFTMPTATAGKSFVLLLKQAATTGNGTATFTSVKWSSSGAPTITAAAGKMDILSFISDGTNWYGSIIQGYTP